MRESGSISVLVVGVAALVLALAAALAGVAAVLHGRLAATTAADAAALAAAPVTFLPFGAEGSPAEEAARFARLNGTDLVMCVCPVDRSFEPRTVEVRVRRRVDVAFLGLVDVEATGRAEFIPALLLGAAPGPE